MSNHAQLTPYDNPNNRPDSEEVQKADRENRLAQVSLLHKIESDAGYVAKFKIEVLFGPKRTVTGPNACAIRIWESGKKLHGGGDVQCYWCLEVDSLDLKKGKVHHRGTAGCGGVIPSSMAGTLTIRNKNTGATSRQLGATCPHCGGIALCERLTTERLFKLTTDKLAEVIAGMWRQLGGDADIYLKYSPGDIRYDAMASAHGLDRARELRGLHIYSVANIIKDTSGGSELAERFKAFLRS